MLLDLTNKPSVESSIQRHPEVLEKARHFHVLFLEVGPKSDLVAQQHVMLEEGRSWLPLRMLAMLRPWPRATVTSTLPLSSSLMGSMRL